LPTNKKVRLIQGIISPSRINKNLQPQTTYLKITDNQCPDLQKGRYLGGTTKLKITDNAHACPDLQKGRYLGGHKKN
jgi:hypothetical protein